MIARFSLSEGGGMKLAQFENLGELGLSLKTWGN